MSAYVFASDLYGCDVVYGCYVVYGYDVMNRFHACYEYCDVWMNVLDMDVYMGVLYIMCIDCASFVIPAVLVILFSANSLNPSYSTTAKDGPS
jgi:hypothetical protein